MSQQQLQQAPEANTSAPEAEDPLAELARIVAGGDILPEQADAAAMAETHALGDDAMMGELEAALANDLEQAAAEEQAARAAPVELDPEQVAPPVPAVPAQDEIQDLESQLMAELGGSSEPVEQIVAPAPIVEDVTAVVEPVAAAPTVPVAEPEFVAEPAPVVEEAVVFEQPVEPVPKPTPETIEVQHSEYAAATVEVTVAEVADPVVHEEPTAPESVDLDFAAAFDTELTQMSGDAQEPAEAATAEETFERILENPFAEDISAEEEIVAPVATAPDVPTQDPIEQAMQTDEAVIEQSSQQLQDAMFEDSDLENAFANAFSDELDKQSNGAVEQMDAMAQQPVEPQISEQHVPQQFAEPQVPEAAPVVDSIPLDEFENAFAHELDADNAQFATGDVPTQFDAAASNIELPNNEDLFADLSAEPPFEPDSDPAQESTTQPSAAELPQKRSGFALPMGRNTVLGAAAAVLLLGGGAVAYTMYAGGNNAPGEPELITADIGDYKQKPDDPGGKEIANQDQPVYDALTGKKEDETAQETLVSDAQEPVKVARSADPLPTTKSDERLSAEDPVVENANAPSTVMKPRRVKTVTVRPDGSLVLASNNIANETQISTGLAPLVPTPPKPAEDTTSIDGAASTGKIPVPSANPTPKPVATALVEEKVDAPAVEATRSLAKPKPVEVKPVAVKPVEVKPEPKPVSLGDADAKPVAPKPVATTVATAGQYVVQISSQRSLEAAQATYQNLNRRFGSLLSGRPVDIKEAVIEGKGTFYRVRVPVGSKQAAANFCGRYKGAGGSCFVTR